MSDDKNAADCIRLLKQAITEYDFVSDVSEERKRKRDEQKKDEDENPNIKRMRL